MEIFFFLNCHFKKPKKKDIKTVNIIFNLCGAKPALTPASIFIAGLGTTFKESNDPKSKLDRLHMHSKGFQTV